MPHTHFCTRVYSFFPVKNGRQIFFFQRKEGNSVEDSQEPHVERQQPESQEDKATLGSEV